MVSGAAVAMLVCCVGPALIAAGALTAVGAVLRNWGLIGAAALVVLAAAAYTVRRRAHRRVDQSDDCCAPAQRDDRLEFPQRDRQS